VPDTAGEDRAIRVWDAVSGEGLFVLRGHPAVIRSLVYTEGGKRLVSVSEDGTLRTWDAETGGQGRRLPAGAAAAVFSPDGKQFATASGKAVLVWDPLTGKQLFALGKYDGPVRSLAYTADGKVLAAVGVLDRPGGELELEIKSWDLSTRKEVHGIH